ncbi:MAG: HEPN domain-containing protein [Anaerolineae bacterium]|jgi:HEPN domain-containing protein
MERSRDWWVQAQADLTHARNARQEGAYEWACFAAHQAAEKAIKAVLEKKGQKAWGHTLTFLLQALQETETLPPELLDQARILDKHYIPTRYPNGLPEGAPTEFYTRQEADDAIRYSEAILRFCDRILHP